MNQAGFLAGLPENVDISGAWQFSAVMDDAKAKDFERNFGIPLTARFRHVPESFGRLLAKIGYGQILSALNPGEFRPLCLPYILGKKRNISHIVGGSFEIPQPTEGIGYVLRTLALGDVSRIILLAEIRLYANLHSPIYHVVVGDVVGEDRVSLAWDKLEGIETFLRFLPHSKNLGLSRQPHWAPHHWPLPK